MDAGKRSEDALISGQQACMHASGSERVSTRLAPLERESRGTVAAAAAQHSSSDEEDGAGRRSQVGAWAAAAGEGLQTGKSGRRFIEPADWRLEAGGSACYAGRESTGEEGRKGQGTRDKGYSLVAILTDARRLVILGAVDVGGVVEGSVSTSDRTSATLVLKMPPKACVRLV